MKYFFVLGKNPTLSMAELSAVFCLHAKETKSPIGDLVSGDIFILEVKEKINAGEVIKKLGGVIKIGIIESAVETRRGASLQHEHHDNTKTRRGVSLLESALKLINLDEITGKFKFGISYYGKNNFNVKPLGMEIKKYLREKNISCRWVVSREPTLSSVVVEQNKLAGKGIEIVLIENPPKPLYQGGSHPPIPMSAEATEKAPLIKGVGGIIIGQTLAVQPFKELSFRDYGRPARDDRSGMIPPKLAQIMINLSAVETRRGASLQCEYRDDNAKTQNLASLLDPFCGSGTILTEALLMGYDNVIGTDISEKAIQDTKKNIAWVERRFKIKDLRFKIFNKSATELSKFIKPNSIDAIVTEPYLGPQRGRVDFKKVTRELENLYSKSLIEFKKVLKSRGRVVMVWPVFRATHNSQRITPKLNGFKIVNPILPGLRENTIIKLTNRSTIIYGREGQKVWREIVVLGII